MDKLENENVSLDFQVQSLIKERENVKLESQKLFDSIKKTQTQTQREINELIESVNQKTFPREQKQKPVGSGKSGLKNNQALVGHLRAKLLERVIQIVMYIVDSGCSKHMTGNLKLLRNFVEKFMGTVRFENEHFAAITGYRDYVHGNITICHVILRDDLLMGSRDSNVYTIFIPDMVASSPVCLMSKATSIKIMVMAPKTFAPEFGTINHLTKQDLVDGLPKFKYDKDHLCSACEQGKSKKASLQPKLVPSTHSKLELIYLDLYGPMRVESISGKKYILVIVDDYSCYTWVYFLCTKDESHT
ncbi:retrovirus-related pol polyprotein from transposon TNT 1-94 [Tanacetum coccineum]